MKVIGEIGTGEFFDLDPNCLVSAMALENVLSSSVLRLVSFLPILMLLEKHLRAGLVQMFNPMQPGNEYRGIFKVTKFQHKISRRDLSRGRASDGDNRTLRVAVFSVEN